TLPECMGRCGNTSTTNLTHCRWANHSPWPLTPQRSLRVIKAISKRQGPCPHPLQVVTYLAPKLFWFYRYLARYLEKKIDCPTELSVGASYDELPGQVDLAFICGLPYIELARRDGNLFEPIAAPVLKAKRYGGKPIYFSDVVVRRDGPFRSFADLRGRSWA